MRSGYYSIPFIWFMVWFVFFNPGRFCGRVFEPSQPVKQTRDPMDAPPMSTPTNTRHEPNQSGNTELSDLAYSPTGSTNEHSGW